jgi:hypothetical protein
MRDAQAEPAPAIARKCSLDRLALAPTSQRSIVAYAYCLVLGRAPTAEERAAHEEAVSAFHTERELVYRLADPPRLGLVENAEALSSSDYVTMAYKLLLLRQPDGGGHTSFVRSLDSGQLNRAELVSSLINSTEFESKHPLMFSRSPSKEAARCHQLSRNGAAAAPAERANYLVCMLVGRQARDDEQERIVEALQSGKSIPDVVVKIVRWSDYALALSGAGTSHSFVMLAYRLLLARAPDGTGLNDYTRELNTGKLTRAGLIRALAASHEFTTKHPSLFRTN